MNNKKIITHMNEWRSRYKDAFKTSEHFWKYFFEELDLIIEELKEDMFPLGPEENLDKDYYFKRYADMFKVQDEPNITYCKKYI